MMLSILIIDDTPEKIQALKSVINEFKSDEIILKTVNDVRKALIELSEHQFDLMLLDMLIPYEWGNDSDPQYALDLLHQLSEDHDLHYPLSVLAITKLDDLKQKYLDELKILTVTLLHYSESNDSWKYQLKNNIRALIGTVKNLYSRCDYIYDVAIINALQTPEFQQLQKVINDNWKRIEIPGDDFNNYYESWIRIKKGSAIRCVCTYANQMAGIASSMLTTKVIYNFRPKYLFMTGIAAGIDSQVVNYGDVLVASEVWDGASGKVKKEGEGIIFTPDPRQKPLAADFASIIQRLMTNKDVLSKISSEFPTVNGKPNSELKVHLGPMASVSAVLSCKEEIEKIKIHSRKLLGIEMESYGMFYAASNAIKPLPKVVASLKSVSDFADEKKDDNFQEYAAYTSAAFLKHIIVNELSY